MDDLRVRWAADVAARGPAFLAMAALGNALGQHGGKVEQILDRRLSCAPNLLGAVRVDLVRLAGLDLYKLCDLTRGEREVGVDFRFQR